MIGAVLTTQGSGLLFLLTVTPLLPDADVTGRDVVFGALAGVTGSSGVALLYLALAIGPMSVVAPVTAVCAAIVPLGIGLALGERPHPPAELATFGRHSVIVINPSRTLEKRTGIELIRLPDGRALISFDRSKTIPGLELVIADALDDPTLPRKDRDVFEAVAGILKSARRSDNVELLQRHVIVLETRRQAAPSRRSSK